ncbi:DUF7314 family protein [Halococcus salsus]|uniref:DUF7314 family protein n=1 Tax=Halococcus salsus TaxID=2162894 RepID=UPI00135936C1|nr:hypothetical protein [Halococcus salsus]
MSDEFAKGFFALCGGLFGWLVLSSWYNTESFESTTQLIAPSPDLGSLYGGIALTTREALFWFAIFGALTFWVVIPAARQARSAWSDRQSS